MQRINYSSLGAQLPILISEVNVARHLPWVNKGYKLGQSAVAKTIMKQEPSSHLHTT